MPGVRGADGRFVKKVLTNDLTVVDENVMVASPITAQDAEKEMHMVNETNAPEGAEVDQVTTAETPNPEVEPEAVVTSGELEAPAKVTREKKAKPEKAAPNPMRGFGPYTVGDRLWARKAGEVYYAEIVRTDDGPAVRLEDVRLTEQGNKHNSLKLVERALGENIMVSGLSKAAGHIQGFQPAITSFWHTGEPTEGRQRKTDADKTEAQRIKAEKAVEKAEKKAAKKSDSTEQTKPVKLFKKANKQEGCEPGNTLWWCNACADGFCLPDGEEPAVCLNGHTAEQFVGGLREQEPVAEPV